MAATRTLVNGSDFGDNIMAVLPDAIGQTIGNIAISAMAGPPAGTASKDKPKPGAGGGQVGNDIERKSMPAEYKLRMNQYNAALDSGAAPDQLESLFRELGLDSVTAGSAPLGAPVVVSALTPLQADSISSTLAVETIAGFQVTNKLASALTERETGYLKGLEVEGKKLTGTVLIDFNNPEALKIDKNRILSAMALINQSTPDGYKIDLNIIEDTFLNRILHPFSPVATVRPVSNMVFTRAPSAGAAYTEGPYGNAILMEPDAPTHWIVHEFAHNLGISHSGFKDSVMFPASSKSSTNDFKLKYGEIRNVVEAYRKAGSK